MRRRHQLTALPVSPDTLADPEPELLEDPHLAVDAQDAACLVPLAQLVPLDATESLVALVLPELPEPLAKPQLLHAK
jgi:hypothetical protein